MEERGSAGVARIRELTDGLGAHSTIEAVGTQESMTQAIRSTRAGGHVADAGVSHDVTLDGQRLFHSGACTCTAALAPVRRFLPELIQLIWDREIDPGVVFDLTLPLEEAAEGYKAMDERRAIKVLLTVESRAAVARHVSTRRAEHAAAAAAAPPRRLRP